MSGSAIISPIPNVLKTVPVHKGGVKGVNGTGVDSDSGLTESMKSGLLGDALKAVPPEAIALAVILA